MSACIQDRVNVATPHAKAKAERSEHSAPPIQCCSASIRLHYKKFIHVSHISPPCALALLAVLLLVIPMDLSQQPGPLHIPLKCCRRLGMDCAPSAEIREPPL